MRTFVTPTMATLRHSNPLVKMFGEAQQERDEVRVDCTHTKFIDPFGATLLAALLAFRKEEQRDTVVIAPYEGEVRRFAAEVGLTTLAASSTEPRGTLEIRQLRALDAVYTSKVTDMLVKGVPGMNSDNSYPIELCLNELLQNVFEWSGSKIGCTVLTRWYHETRAVSICVLDLGIGIPAALRRKQIRELHRASDSAVVEAAVTQRYLTSRDNQVGGLGLKTIREIVCARGGRLTVLSQSAKLAWTTTETAGRQSRPPVFRGTAVCIEFRPAAKVKNPREFVPVF
jgi:signal transduction histidine kinase